MDSSQVEPLYRTLRITPSGPTCSGFHASAKQTKDATHAFDAIERGISEMPWIARLRRMTSGAGTIRRDVAARCVVRNWERVIPFFAYPEDVRRISYTTNAIESLHSQVREQKLRLQNAVDRRTAILGGTPVRLFQNSQKGVAADRATSIGVGFLYTD